MLRAALVQIRTALVVTFTALPAIVIVVALPRERLRRHFARWAAYWTLRFAGIRITVQGLQHFPSDACVVVANHASYLDGVVLMAALPPRFTFLIKAEVNRLPLVGLLLRRLGMEFVSRASQSAASSSATRLIRAARRGKAIGVFPEGTFLREPGLRAFHLGAFAAASYARLPVVPTIIHGTRSILPAHSWLIRPKPVCVQLTGPIITEKTGRGGAVFLCNQARDVISTSGQEPDTDTLQTAE